MPIAAGGMGQVWVGQQTGQHNFRKLVAIKIIRPEMATDASFRAMFLDEAQLAARIRHANVVEVVDLGEDGGLLYQVMTLIEGAALSTLIARAREKRNDAGLPLSVAVRIVIDTLRGLHAAHELRDDQDVALHLVHRDVSPQNVLVGVDGVAKLGDFGIAKAFGRRAAETNAGELKGKLRYLAPEQIEGISPTRQSDLFSVGVVLWESLTGRSLFAVEPGEEGIRARKTAPVPSPSSVAPHVPETIAKVTLRALERSPSARFTSALQMAEALEEAARDSGALATAQDVAGFVEEMIGDEIARRKELLRAARSGAPPPMTAVPPQPSVPRTLGGSYADVRPEPAKRHKGAWLVAGLGCCAIIVWFAVAKVRSRPVEPAAASVAASSAVSVAPAVPTQAAAPETKLPVVATSPGVEASASVPRKQQRPPARGVRAVKGSRAMSATTGAAPSSTEPRPTFESPYE
jgi:serine/threonine-protein kinase